ncbi:hypothetical protein ACO2Q0_02675 [Phenylobacterium sp. VNQ135]|uniref:hypothetical protein n=1 Tax=Phenylobacterium sp. VNQ135 TaxID=3400922 RepID=UPI003C03216D
MSTTDKAAFIYGLTDPETGAVRYIGKANSVEARFRGHLRETRRRRTPLYDWMRKVLDAGQVPGVVVLERCVGDWREAERRLIAEARARGDRILNLADGGDQPSCPAKIRSENGHRLVEKIRTDDEFRRIWVLKREMQSRLRDGLLSNKTRALLRQAAIDRPDVFGIWANLPDREEDENGLPVGGYGKIKGGRYGAPLQADPKGR